MRQLLDVVYVSLCRQWELQLAEWAGILPELLPDKRGKTLPGTNERISPHLSSMKRGNKIEKERVVGVVVVEEEKEVVWVGVGKGWD